MTNGTTNGESDDLIGAHERRSTILVIDDDDDVNESVAEALGAEGYDVVQAHSGREGLNLLIEGGLRPAMILLDMMMPEMDGWGFRAEQDKVPALASIPVVLFTAHGVPDATSTQLGAAGLLRKPIRLTALLAEIERVERTTLTTSAQPR